MTKHNNAQCVRTASIPAPTPGIGTSWSVLEANWTILAEVSLDFSFCVLDLEIFQPPKCSGKIEGPWRNILVFTWSKLVYLQLSYGQKRFKHLGEFRILDLDLW